MEPVKIWNLKRDQHISSISFLVYVKAIWNSCFLFNITYFLAVTFSKRMLKYVYTNIYLFEIFKDNIIII